MENRNNINRDIDREYKRQAIPAIGAAIALYNLVKGRTCLPKDLIYSPRKDLFQFYLYYQLLSVGAALRAVKLGLDAIFFELTY